MVDKAKIFKDFKKEVGDVYNASSKLRELVNNDDATVGDILPHLSILERIVPTLHASIYILAKCD